MGIVGVSAFSSFRIQRPICNGSWGIDRQCISSSTAKMKMMSTPVTTTTFLLASKSYNEDDDMDDQDEDLPPSNPFDDDDFGNPLVRARVESLTVPQLKQQLRLRGAKVSGRKAELIERLLSLSLSSSGTVSEESDDTTELEPELVDQETVEKKKSKAREFAEARGKKLVDVTAYLDEDDIGKETRTTQKENEDDEETEEEGNDSAEATPEVWGDEARIVDDYDGRSPVVDGLSRTVVTFRGSNKTKVEAFVVASRAALQPFLRGGDLGKNATETSKVRVEQIQIRRERASKKPVKPEEAIREGPDVDDEEGRYRNVIERDYGDWGVYSPTGAQISAQEVQGVLLLTDVYGAFSDDMEALAEKIAFECQPVVVMVPDLFRGHPWKEDPENPGFNSRGENYEQWRATHSDHRVSIDIRAAAATLRERYGVSSIAVFGTCYGGGRALEVASGWYPSETFMFDVDGVTLGPTPVEPLACVAWYPTRYDARALFGPDHKGSSLNYEGKERNVAIMAIFAGDDEIPGARPDDAQLLKELLDNDKRMKDRMVKVFPNQGHGFAHIGLGAAKNEAATGDDETDEFLREEFGGSGSYDVDGADAEVASLLSTAWMETYTRVFLPTVGTAVMDDEDQSWSDLEMKDLSYSRNRDVRGELENAVDTHVDEEVDFSRMNPESFLNPDAFMTEDALDTRVTDLIEMLKEKSVFITPEDDEVTVRQKLQAAAARGDLDDLSWGNIPLDDTEEAYW